ncbi:hypothetical protein [Flagellimonas sp. 2504JD1-5]
MKLENKFIEQAEYIPKEEFPLLSSIHPNEDVILKKLTQSGAKLITGPRGCGKTTLILKAYNMLLSKKNSAFGIYINFKSSLKLEPIYKSNANGSYWFTYWMYLKIYEGLYQTMKDYSKSSEDLSISLEDTIVLLNYLELGDIDNAKTHEKDINYYSLENDINVVLKVLNKNRCVILFDDAAHAFSVEQQRDFFDFFRKIKTRYISPKAAIYPGVTSFAPTFNIGHDAEEINAWLDPENESYFMFMNELLKKRVPDEVYQILADNKYLLYIICYAAFGIPRQLLNIVRNLYNEQKDGDIEIKINRTNIFKQIRISYKSTMNVFTSLKNKIPTYSSYIEEGQEVYDRIIDLVKIYNRNKKAERKSITIAIRKEVNPDLKKIIGFYQYAGLLSHKGQLSKGEKGTFELYLINIGALIDNNALLTTKGINLADLATSLLSRNAHEFTRTQSEKLLTKGMEPLKLSLPPCQSCKTERINESALFCYNCGAPLITASTYEKLISDSISNLNLTDHRVTTIKSHSSIKEIKDILYDIGGTELQTVPQVGKYWASKIYYLAEEYIS